MYQVNTYASHAIDRVINHENHIQNHISENHFINYNYKRRVINHDNHTINHIY